MILLARSISCESRRIDLTPRMSSKGGRFPRFCGDFPILTDMGMSGTHLIVAKPGVTVVASQANLFGEIRG